LLSKFGGASHDPFNNLARIPEKVWLLMLRLGVPRILSRLTLSGQSSKLIGYSL